VSLREGEREFDATPDWAGRRRGGVGSMLVELKMEEARASARGCQYQCYQAPGHGL
jgi:hypothetical protein